MCLLYEMPINHFSTWLFFISLFIFKNSLYILYIFYIFQNIYIYISVRCIYDKCPLPICHVFFHFICLFSIQFFILICQAAIIFITGFYNLISFKKYFLPKVTKIFFYIFSKSHKIVLSHLHPCSCRIYFCV